MKKMSPALRDRQRRQRAKQGRVAKKLEIMRRRARRRQRRRGQTQWRRIHGPLLIPVPNQLRFHGSKATRETFDGFADRVAMALRDGRRVRLDFSGTERLFPCGMLLFLGLLDKWQRTHPEKLSATYPQDDVVEQMLQSASVIQKLGLPTRKVVSHDEVVKWHQFHGTNVDATPIEPFMLEVQAAAGLEWQLGLGDCIGEALTNVKKHAYGSEEGAAPWWMFATLNAEAKQIFVAMHDRGESIPGTLLAKPDLIDAVTFRRLRRGGDCELISAAAGGRTRTKLYYRGKGLPEMVEFTSRHANNALAIYSRRGYFGASRAGKLIRQGSLGHPVEGTLVIWTLNYGEQS
jgi:hypothetical protein